VFFLSAIAFGQTPYPGCPNVSSTATDPGSITQNDTIFLACGDTCADLQATFLQTGSSTQYKTQSIPFAPPFAFTGGTSIFVGSDDVYTGVINLPFQFCFFENIYNQIIIGANGLISFDIAKAGTNCCYIITNPIRNATNAANCGLLADGNGNMLWNSIYGAFHDMDPTVGNPNINYSILGQFPCRTFVVNWSNVTHFSSSCTGKITTQQIVLYETTNVIEVYIKDKPLCTGSTSSGRAVLGIQNRDGSLAYSPPGRNTGQWSAKNEAWRFTPDGAPNYSISWLDEANNVLATGANLNICAPAGNPPFKIYTQVKYSNCGALQVLVKDSVQVVPAPPYKASLQKTNVSCNGACDGTASVTVTGGKAPFTFTWPFGPGQASETNICAQSGTITVTDANNCTKTIPLNITEPSALTTTVAKTDVLCNGETNGTATVSVSGGTSPYVYSWTSGSTIKTSTGGAGKQVVTVTDKNGCVKKDSITILEPAVLKLDTLYLQHLSCQSAQDGEIALVGIGGVTPYTFSIDAKPFTGSSTFSNLQKGPHTIIIKDANNCTDTKTYILKADSISVFAPKDTIICEGSSITLAATGFFTSVDWTQAEVTDGVAFVPMNTGINTYEVTATNSSGCTATDEVLVDVKPIKDPTITPVGPYCLGEPDVTLQTVDVGGTWGGTGVSASGVFSPNTAGSGSHKVHYSFTGICPSSDTITIEINSSFQADINPVAPVCESDPSFNLTSVTPGGTWNGSGIANTASPRFNPQLAGPGTHRIYHTIAGSCGETDSTDIQVMPSVFGAIDATVQFCHDGSALNLSATPAGGSWTTTPYLTSTGSFDPTLIGSGLHQVIYTPSGNCAKKDTAVIMVFDTLVALPDTFNLACKNNTSATLTTQVSGGSQQGYMYTWSHDASVNTATATNLSAGKYTVNIVDSKGCSTSVEHVVTEPANGLTLGSIALTHVNCNGGSDGSIDIPVSGGTPNATGNPYTYSITPNVGTEASGVFSGLPTGTYTITITDANACSISSIQTITEPNSIQVQTTVTTANCSQSDGSVHIDITTGGTQPYTYYWDGTLETDTHLTNVGTGTYVLKIIDANNCTLTQNLVVPNKTGPTISFVTTQTSCNGSADGGIVGHITGGTAPYPTLDWGTSNLPNDSVQTGLVAGSYTVTVYDSEGCAVTNTAIVTEPTLVVLNNINDTTICDAQTLNINFSASGGNGPSYSYSVNNGPQISNPFNTNTTGTYQVQAFDVNSCPSAPKSFNLSFFPSITTSITVQSPGIFCPGDPVTLTASATGGNGSPFVYSWSDGSVGNPITYQSDFSGNPVTLDVYATDNCSVHATGSATINFYTLPPIDYTILPPNGCTPLTSQLSVDPTDFKNFNWSVGNISSTASSWQYSQTSPGTYPVTLKTESNEGCIAVHNLGTIDVYPLPIGRLKQDPIALTTIENRALFSVFGTDIKRVAWEINSLPSNSTLVVDTTNSNSLNYLFDPIPGNFELLVTLISPHGCLSYLNHKFNLTPVHTVFVPNAFTPDKDGRNETFSISTTYVDTEDFQVEIFNRWGERIYVSNDLYFKWDGTYQGELVTNGVYTYRISYRVTQGNKKAAYGFVTVLY